MPGKTLKIDNASFILTLDGQRRIIKEGSIVIEGQKITQVGKAKDLTKAQADRVIDARNMLVTPGFFNGHMHISYAHAVRGIFPDNLASPLNHVFKLQMAMTEEEEHATTLLGLVDRQRLDFGQIAPNQFQGHTTHDLIWRFVGHKKIT